PNGTGFSTDLPPDAGRVMADARRTTQVCANLISTASKYAPEGTKVTIRAQTADGFVRVTVADEGPGIPLDEQNRLFQRFFRSRTVREQAGGLGLVLSICRVIVHAQGGNLANESGHGHGTSQHFTVPKARTRARVAARRRRLHPQTVPAEGARRASEGDPAALGANARATSTRDLQDRRPHPR